VPPGLASVFTDPLVIGSDSRSIPTIGTVVVARIAARILGGPPITRTSVGVLARFSPTRVSAPSAEYHSNVMLRPTTQPSSRNPSMIESRVDSAVV
jgi:hypothetical protein